MNYIRVQVILGCTGVDSMRRNPRSATTHHAPMRRMRKIVEDFPVRGLDRFLKRNFFGVRKGRLSAPRSLGGHMIKPSKTFPVRGRLKM